MGSSLRVTAARFKPALDRGDGVRGWVVIELNGAIEIDGCTLRAISGGDLRITLPYRLDGAGRAHPTVRVVAGTVRRELEAQALELLRSRGVLP